MAKVVVYLGSKRSVMKNAHPEANGHTIYFILAGLLMRDDLVTWDM